MVRRIPGYLLTLLLGSCTGKNSPQTIETARASVIDHATGLGLAGAVVYCCSRNACTRASTDASGLAACVQDAEVAEPSELAVHAFHRDYGWLSILGTRSRSFLLPLELNRDLSSAGGFQGRIVAEDLPGAGEVVVGFGGASFAGELIDITPESFFGANVRTRVQLGTLFDDFINLPAGLVLELGSQAVKMTYQVEADGPVRHAWGLGGRMSLNELLDVLSPALSGNSSSETVGLGILSDLFRKGRHGLNLDVAIVPILKVTDSQDLNGNGKTDDSVPDFANFPQVNIRPVEPVSLSASISFPRLPMLGTVCASSILSTLLISVPGRGHVPYGLIFADDNRVVDETDCLVDPTALTFAPTYADINGAEPTILALALSGSSTSGIIVTQTVPVPPVLNFDGLSFLDFPTNVSYKSVGRRFVVDASASSAHLYRAAFEQDGKSWKIYFAPSEGGWSLPEPPDGLVDRAVGQIRVTAMALRDETHSGDFGSFERKELISLSRHVSAFACHVCKDNDSCAAP